MPNLTPREEEVNTALLAMEEQLKGVGHIKCVSLDFIEPEDNERDYVVDADGKFILLADVVLKFLVYEKSISADISSALKATSEAVQKQLARGRRKAVAQ